MIKELLVQRRDSEMNIDFSVFFQTPTEHNQP